MTSAPGRRRMRSPPTTRCRSCRSCGQGRSRSGSTVGVAATACVRARSRHQSVRTWLSQRVSSGAGTRAAPEVSPAHSSSRCGSNATPISRDWRSPGARPVSARYQSRATEREASATATALGRPVEPEVRTAYRALSGARRVPRAESVKAATTAAGALTPSVGSGSGRCSPARCPSGRTPGSPMRQATSRSSVTAWVRRSPGRGPSGR